MENINELYVATLRFPRISGEIKFYYSTMEIKKVYPDMIEIRYPYFINKTYSTRYFDKNMLDREYEINDSLTVYFSSSKDKCIEWLEFKRAFLLRDYEYNYERLKQSQIKEIKESDLIGFR